MLIGLALFLVGLEWALFPLGKLMAVQLTDPEFICAGEAARSFDWRDYGWVYLFAFMVGFSTTIAEPSLIAVAIKANEVSGGAISAWGLRIAVAFGVAFGITSAATASSSAIRSTGTSSSDTSWSSWRRPAFAPKLIIPLAYDSGGVTTSTVTVPLVAALGLGLSQSVPGRNPLIDGFGLIAFASLFPSCR